MPWMISGGKAFQTNRRISIIFLMWELALDAPRHQAGQCGHDEVNIWRIVRDKGEII